MSLIIVGNKDYKNLHLGKLIDSFDDIKRCNMSLPIGINGNKYGSLGFCSHLYQNLITNKLSKSEFYSQYTTYKKEDIDYFFENFSPSDYSECYYQKSDINKANNYLSSSGCPFKLVKMPRTGFAILIDCLVKGLVINVFGFSIKDEVRASKYVKENMGDSHCHDKESEIKILRWLHENDIIDASLCLLKDETQISFDSDELKPTTYMTKLMELYYDAKNTN